HWAAEPATHGSRWARPSGSGTSAGSGTGCGDVGSPRTSRRFLGEERRRIAQKIPLLLHPRQFQLERQQLLVTGHAVARERLLAVCFQVLAQTMDLVGTDPQVTGDLRDVGSRQSRQANCLTLELFAVSLSFLHDTPPAPSWGLTEVSVLAG